MVNEDFELTATKKTTDPWFDIGADLFTSEIGVARVSAYKNLLTDEGEDQWIIDVIGVYNGMFIFIYTEQDARDVFSKVMALPSVNRENLAALGFNEET